MTRDDADDEKPLLEGWSALRRGDWARARAHFDAAVVGGASPEAYEGLSWAAWWLDDADAVFEAREAAFKGYREAGDVAGAARMATWLGADQLDFNGALATANGWLERAGRLLESGQAELETGWLAFHRGFIANLKGESERAQELGALAAHVGRQMGVVDLEMLGLALQGMSLVSCAEVAQGMKCLEEASAFALTDEAEIPISSAWTCCFLVTACTRVLDFDRAFEWCDRIFAFAERYGSRYMLGFCRAEYATVHLWRGRWDEAERALQESLEAFAQSRPGMVSGPLASLAELRRRQGRSDEALELLERAGATRAAQLCRGRLALDRGDFTGALELGERVLRKLSDSAPLDRLPALELVVLARLAQGAFDEARAALAQLEALARVVNTAGYAARVAVLNGMLRLASGAPEQAKPLLEDAVDGFERCGARFDAACARVELASALAALERLDDARREASVARKRLVALGAAPAATRAEGLLAPPKARERDRAALLSARESEVVDLLSEGMTNRSIARRLHISEHTVHRHVTSILRKLEVPSRTAAAAWALKNGPNRSQ